MDFKNDKFFEARVLSRRDIAANLWSVRLQPGGKFQFTPGQYATVGTLSSSKHVERPYSIVSSPYEDELEFFFELVPGGEVTPHLYKLRIGDVMSLRKTAKGHFTLDMSSGQKNHLLLCTVTGVAPFVSFVRTLRKEWTDGQLGQMHKLFILNGASRSWELGYREELERDAAEVPWLKYVATVSRPWEDPAWSGELGRVDDLIRKYTDLWGLTPETTAAYLCGHPQMIETGKGILIRRGWKDDALRQEIYFPAEKKAQAESGPG